jgi:hypothetical protein
MQLSFLEDKTKTEHGSIFRNLTTCIRTFLQCIKASQFKGVPELSCLINVLQYVRDANKKRKM